MKKLCTLLLALCCAISAFAQTECPTTVSVSNVQYNVTQVGSQCWTASNMRNTTYADGVSIVPEPLPYTSTSYPNMDVNSYGFLYTAAAATRNGTLVNGELQGVCPEGWHIPTQADMNTLLQNTTVERLLSDEGWLPQGGNNSTGFNLLPAGSYNATTGLFEDYGVATTLLTAEPGTTIYHPCQFGAFCGTWEYIPGNDNESYSVRCMRDVEADFVCGTSKMKDAENNEYTTVQIGTQCWTAQNLRTQEINGFGNVYNPAELGQSGYDVETYGLLYDWYATMQVANTSAKGAGSHHDICPDGWHVPSDAEWTQLTDYVLSQSEYRCSGNTNNIAKALASTTGWNSYTGNSSDKACFPGYNPSGNNATGFSALPAGYYDSSYDYFGTDAYFWSATERSSDGAYGRYLSYSYAGVARYDYYKSDGYSVRCVRD